MRSTERRARNFSDLGVRIALLTLAAILLITLQISGNLRPAQNLITQLTAPAQLSATGVTSTVNRFFAFLGRVRTLEQEYFALEARAKQLEAEIETLREVEKENEQLRSLLKFAQTRPRLELRGAEIVARVVGEESTNFSDTILIDLGAVHGIRTGMPVVTDQGLVGRISEVTENNAKVLLLTDPSSSASALMAESRLNGIVRGGTGGKLIMDFIPQGPTFNLGETVLSSGLGGRFPKGLTIGVIESIESQPNAVFQTALIRPAVDFGSLELVMVITNFEPSEALPEFLLQPAEETPASEAEETTPEATP